MHNYVLFDWHHRKLLVADHWIWFDSSIGIPHDSGLILLIIFFLCNSCGVPLRLILENVWMISKWDVYLRYRGIFVNNITLINIFCEQATKISALNIRRALHDLLSQGIWARSRCFEYWFENSKRNKEMNAIISALALLAEWPIKVFIYLVLFYSVFEVHTDLNLILFCRRSTCRVI